MRGKKICSGECRPTCVLRMVALSALCLLFNFHQHFRLRPSTCLPSLQNLYSRVILFSHHANLSSEVLCRKGCSKNLCGPSVGIQGANQGENTSRDSNKEARTWSTVERESTGRGSSAVNPCRYVQASCLLMAVLTAHQDTPSKQSILYDLGSSKRTTR